MILRKRIGYCIANAYDDKFDTAAVPVVKLKNHTTLNFSMVLSFKDMYSILYLLTSAKKQGVDNKIVLTATSGDE